MRVTRQLKKLALAIAGSAVFLGFASPPAVGQQSPASQSIPRTADGKPDFSGFWEVLSKADENIEAHSAGRGISASIGIVQGGELPYQPDALAKRKHNFATRQTADTEAKCYLPGVPRIMYIQHPFQIVQTPDLVLMLFEYLHGKRNVFMNSKHLEGPLDWWIGDSRGSWDGDTLVVDVNNFNDETWFDRAGNYHSDELHVIERYALDGPDHIHYTATVEDAKVFTRPWEMNLVFYRHTEPNFQLLDYECEAFLLNDVPLIANKK
jgi:hypothetical protein